VLHPVITPPHSLVPDLYRRTRRDNTGEASRPPSTITPPLLTKQGSLFRRSAASYHLPLLSIRRKLYTSSHSNSTPSHIAAARGSSGVSRNTTSGQISKSSPPCPFPYPLFPFLSHPSFPFPPVPSPSPPSLPFHVPFPPLPYSQPFPSPSLPPFPRIMAREPGGAL